MTGVATIAVTVEAVAVVAATVGVVKVAYVMTEVTGPGAEEGPEEEDTINVVEIGEAVVSNGEVAVALGGEDMKIGNGTMTGSQIGRRSETSMRTGEEEGGAVGGAEAGGDVDPTTMR